MAKSVNLGEFFTLAHIKRAYEICTEEYLKEGNTSERIKAFASCQTRLVAEVTGHIAPTINAALSNGDTATVTAENLALKIIEMYVNAVRRAAEECSVAVAEQGAHAVRYI